LGEITKYVIRKAPVRVILTAPPATRREDASEVDERRPPEDAVARGAGAAQPVGARAGEAPVVAGAGGERSSAVRRRIRLADARRRPHR
jgi:hypothetical protein